MRRCFIAIGFVALLYGCSTEMLKVQNPQQAPIDAEELELQKLAREFSELQWQQARIKAKELELQNLIRELQELHGQQAGLLLAMIPFNPRGREEISAHELAKLFSTELPKGRYATAAPNLLRTETAQGALLAISDTFEIASFHEGELVTEWKPVPGKRAGYGLWEKVWLAEVRHIITIKSSYEASGGVSEYVIKTEVRERPNKDYPWAEGSVDLGSSSQLVLKNRMDQAVSDYTKRAQK